MASEARQTSSNTASSEATGSVAEETDQTDQTLDDGLEEQSSDRTTEVVVDRVRKARPPQQQDPNRPRSVYAVGKYVPRRSTQNSRSSTPGNCRGPREFLTGIEHKTKFMRDTMQDASSSRKSRFNNSGATSSRGQQQTRAETRAGNTWRQDILDICLERQPQKKRDGKELTKVGSYLSRAFPDRIQPQLNNKSAEVRIINAADQNTATNSKLVSANSKSAIIPVNKCTGTAKECSDATKAGKISKLQKINRLSRPSNESVKLEASAIQGEEMREDSSSSPTLDQTSDMPEPNASDNLKQGGTNKGGSSLWLNLPKSPTSEQRSSNNSRRTTPRSARCPTPGQKLFSNSRLNLPTAGNTPSAQQTGNSVTSSETLETQNTSTPQVNGSSSTTLRVTPINKCKFLPPRSSDNNTNVANKPRDLLAKSSHHKMTTATKQEPMTFTTHFVPLLRWTNKTSSDDLFEPHGHQAPNNRPNSTNSNANPDSGNNALNGKPADGELLSIETAGCNVVQNACYIKQQQGADEDNEILHPSLLFTSGEGENLANVRRSKKSSPTQDGALSTDADRSQTRSHATPLKQVWRLTGPQQIVSGCTLSSSTTSDQIRRPQSVKNVAMAKEYAAYLRSANRPIFAGMKEKTNETTGNKRPVWK